MEWPGGRQDGAACRGLRRPGDIPVAGRRQPVPSESGFEAGCSLCDMVSSAWGWATSPYAFQTNHAHSADLEAARKRAHAAADARWPLVLTA